LADICHKHSPLQLLYDILSKKASLLKGFGARPLNRLIVSEIENKVASMMVEGIVSRGETITLAASNDEIICIKANYALSK
jgi:ATP-dependent Clp protease ATP-binding subunit ClpA